MSHTGLEYSDLLRSSPSVFSVAKRNSSDATGAATSALSVGQTPAAERDHERRGWPDARKTHGIVDGETPWK